ncbi:branched-chain amino acid transport system II carrier protein [Caldisericum sp.]|uniref:branched-chain amino acid transport system II carrier protein n=1 Tax=Caldisericum sp. TaxID=2499687 RepID=UPI003D0F5ECE
MNKMNTKGRNLLPWVVVFVIAAAVFSGHFGVGDVIFPAILGRNSGATWFIAALGYGVINSLGVFVAYLVVATHNKSLLGLTSMVLGKNYGRVYTTIAMLIMGPVFILPRVSSATHEMAVAPFFPAIPLWITLLIYFALNFYFAYNRSKVIDRLGKFLAPTLIIFMLILIVKGIISPLAAPVSPGSSTAFTDGILNGYNTMNALGASIFGIWLINELSRRGLKDAETQRINLITIGSIAALGLLLTSIGLTYLGASSGALFPKAQIGELSVDISNGLLGYFGKVVFGIIIAFACITTSVGLTSAAGDTFEQITNGKLKYKLTVGLSSLVGFLLGLVGLSRIVGYTVPWLMLIYPALIVLLIMGLFSRFEKVKLAAQAGTIVAIIFSIGDFLGGLGIGNNPFTKMNSVLPLGKQGMAWLLPVVIAVIIFQIISAFIKTKTLTKA